MALRQSRNHSVSPDVEVESLFGVYTEVRTVDMQLGVLAKAQAGAALAREPTSAGARPSSADSCRDSD